MGYEPIKDEYYAVKLIKYSHPDLNLKNLKSEIKVLSLLKHPNVVSLIDFYESVDYVRRDGSSYKVVAIVLELACGGEIFEYVVNSGRFSEKIARTYFQTLIEGKEES